MNNVRMAAASRNLFLFLFAAFLSMPLIIVAGVSFNATRRMSFPPQQWSLHWYADFFGDPGWMGALELSLFVGVASALLAASAALPICYFGWKYMMRLTTVLTGLGSLPFMLPPIVLAVVFLVFWSLLGHVGQVEDLVIAHGIVFMQLPIAAMALGFRSIDRALIDAAGTLGARDEDVFRTIVLPIVLPYIVSGALFVFLLSLNEYIIAQMVVGFAMETLPVKIFNSLRTGFSPSMCVGAVLFMLVGLVGYSLIAWIGDLPKLLGSESAK
ncbi:MAG: ABC transporter permease subunit [Parvibaculaceae bacterium]|nr:ABC transporter permease subunit [Parvibaculaceae bacterium]